MLRAVFFPAMTNDYTIKFAALLSSPSTCILEPGREGRIARLVNGSLPGLLSCYDVFF